MCGINGFFSTNKKLKIDIKKMNSFLIHRGPDNSGVYNDDKFNISFGHTRLSIVDLEDRSNQPFIYENIILTFNGEIYNFLDLKKEFFYDSNFITTSDTEVLAKLYLKFGIEKTLNLVNGMFAFSIYDKKLNKLFLCRDKIGKKPLYYFLDDEKLIFSSELKAFKGLIDLKLDQNVFLETLHNRFSERLSPFKNIDLLKNGHFLEVNLNKFEVKFNKYFGFEDLIDKNIYDKLNKMTLNEVSFELERIIRKSLSLRLITDVDIGTVNSGGLDSSLISAMVLEQKKLKMFHIDVEANSELQYAKILSDKLGVKLISEKLTNKNFNNEIDKTIYHYEYPLVHPNSYGILLLSKLANSENIKVLLSGDGADELFGGYGFFISQYKRLFFPFSILSFLKKIKTFVKKGKNYFNSSTRDRIMKFENIYSFISDEEEIKMNAILLNSLYEYLQPLNLRVDKMGMANSVEFRCPFLDINVIEFALNLPLKFKMDKKSGKIILKNIAANKLPKSLIDRTKMGFPVPLVENAIIDKSKSVNENYVMYSHKVLKNKFKKN